MVYGHVWRSAVWHSKDGKVLGWLTQELHGTIQWFFPYLVLLSRYLRPKIIFFFFLFLTVTFHIWETTYNWWSSWITKMCSILASVKSLWNVTFWRRGALDWKSNSWLMGLIFTILVSHTLVRTRQNLCLNELWTRFFLSSVVLYRGSIIPKLAIWWVTDFLVY